MRDLARISELEKAGNDAANKGEFPAACRIYQELLTLNLTRLDRARALANLTNFASQAGLRDEAVEAGEKVLALLGDAPWESNEEASIHGTVTGLLARGVESMLYGAAGLAAGFLGGFLAIQLFPGSLIALACGAAAGFFAVSRGVLVVAKASAAQLLAMSVMVPAQFVGSQDHRRRINRLATILLIIAVFVLGIACLFSLLQKP